MADSNVPAAHKSALAAQPGPRASDLDAMFRTSRGVRVARAVLLAVVVLLGIVIWRMFGFLYEHLHAKALIESSGGNVEWEIDRSSWGHGGTSRVASHPRFARPLLHDRDLAALEHLHRLVELDLKRDSEITDAGLAYVEGLPWLRVLLLGDRDVGQGPQISDAGLVHLRGLDRLEELSLAQARISDTGLARLKALKNLTILDLSETPVTSAGMSHLVGLPRLEQLDLRGTNLTDEGLLKLGAMPRLRMLNVEKTKVTAGGVFQLLQSRPELDLYHDFAESAFVKVGR